MVSAWHFKGGFFPHGFRMEGLIKINFPASNLRSRQYVSVNGVAQYVSVVILAQAIEGITFPYYSILSSQVSPLPRDVRLPCSINVLGR